MQQIAKTAGASAGAQKGKEVMCVGHSMDRVQYYQGAHPPTNSALDSLKGFPDSTVMMVQMSSSAATTRSYHLHRKHPF